MSAMTDTPAEVRALADAYLINPRSGCWVWTGKINRRGYGYAGPNNRAAHRILYELHVGPIPDGLVIDHLCRNKLCVNPAHLEPVTPKENTLRGIGPTAVNALKTHCPKGHPYDDSNTKDRGHGRECRVCYNARTRLYKQRVRQEARQQRESALDAR